MLQYIQQSLHQLADPARAESSQRFFKTDDWDYGAGDQFLGIRVPEIRKVAKSYRQKTTLDDIAHLLVSLVHEHRFAATELLCFHFTAKHPVYSQEQIINFYVTHLEGINNWDLVDNSAYSLLGDRLKDKKDRSILYDFARSGSLRKMRIAMIATMAFLREGQLDDTYDVAEILLVYQIKKDPKHEFGWRGGRELTNKAVGWLLRETRYKDTERLRNFLTRHISYLPRTMLRYAIEKMDEQERKQWLVKK